MTDLQCKAGARSYQCYALMYKGAPLTKAGDVHKCRDALGFLSNDFPILR